MHGPPASGLWWKGGDEANGIDSARWTPTRSVSRQAPAAADRAGVLLDAVDGLAGVGTIIRPHDRLLSARKLWIAFAVGASGLVVVDDGARAALVDRRTSLLPAGVVAVEGSFDADDAVEIAGVDGRVFAKGLVRHPATRIKEWAGRRSSTLPQDMAHEVVHRDDLVVLP